MQHKIEDLVSVRRRCFGKALGLGLLLLIASPIILVFLYIGLAMIHAALFDGYRTNLSWFDYHQSDSHDAYPSLTFPVGSFLIWAACAYGLYRCWRLFRANWARWTASADQHLRAVRELERFDTTHMAEATPASSE